MVKKKKAGKSGFKQWIIPIILAYFLILLFRIFIGFPLSVSNSSMLYSLKPGNLVWLNKLAYGVRLPNTLLSIQPFTNLYIKQIQLPYYRLGGLKTPNLFDKVLINFPIDAENPIDKRPLLIKRIAGLPNQKVLFAQGNLYLNDSLVSMPNEVCLSYKVKFKSKPESSFFEEQGIINGQVFEGKNTFELNLTKTQAENLVKLPNILSVEPLFVEPKVGDTSAFPGIAMYPWNRDFFGPIWIPAANESIKLNAENFILYKTFIEDETNAKLERKEKQYYLNNTLVENYTFKYDYFFVLGDNLHDSSDSRNWGFVSEKYLVGEIIKLF